MKTSTKWLLAAGIMILVGMIISLIALASTGFKLAALSVTSHDITTQVHTQVLGPDEEINQLLLESIDTDIIITASDDNMISISYPESDTSGFDIEFSDAGVLSIKQTINQGSRHIRFFPFDLDFSFNPEAMRITLPLDMCHDLNISSTSGYISIAGISCNDIILSSTSGEIIVNNCMSDLLKLQSTSGDIWVKSSACSTAAFDTTSGEIDGIDLNCSSNMTLESTSGDIYLQSPVCQLSAWLQSTSGDIEFYNMEAAQLTIITSSGDIEGYLLGDTVLYDIQVKSVSGDIEIPRTTPGASRPVLLETLSGDIEIDIHE